MFEPNTKTNGYYKELRLLEGGCINNLRFEKQKTLKTCSGNHSKTYFKVAVLGLNVIVIK